MRTPLLTLHFEDYPLHVHLGTTLPEYYHQPQQLPKNYLDQFERGEVVFRRTPQTGDRPVLVHAASGAAVVKNSAQAGQPRLLATSGNRLLKGKLGRDELRQVQNALEAYFEQRMPDSLTDLPLPVEVEFIYTLRREHIDSLNHHRILLESELVGCLARRLPCFSSVDCISAFVSRYWPSPDASRRLTVNIHPTA